MKKVSITLHPEVETLVSVGWIQFSGLECRGHIPELWQEIDLLSETYREAYPEPSRALEQLAPARKLYRAIGIEPTKVRPSSEALFRRVVKGKPLYRINSIVDVCNYCSLAFFLPIGLYDLDKVQGEIVLRLGKEGESYPGIGKDKIHVEGRLTLADDAGAFGNPSADSLRTSIDLSSRNVLMVIFAPNFYASEKMFAHLEFARQTMLRYHPGGKVVASFPPE